MILAEVGRHMPRRKGTGSGWLKKDGGNWVGHWYDYSGGAKKERVWTVGPIKEHSKTNARKELAEHIKDFRPSAQMLFSAAVEKYIALRKGRWGKNHRQAIESIFGEAEEVIDKRTNKPKPPYGINAVLGLHTVSEISPADIQTFLNTLAEGGSQSLLKKCLTHIRGVFAMLVEEDILKKNPGKSSTVYLPNTRAVDKTYLELWECKALLEAAKDRDYLILRLLLSAALRPSELFALRPDDIETRRLRIDEVAVPGEKIKPYTKSSRVRKGGNKEEIQYVPISEETEQVLRMFAVREQFGPRDLMFPSELGTAMSHENWRARNLAKIRAAAGIETRVDYKILRRTVATLVQKDGTPKDIQTLLRHADITTTLGIYQQAIPESVNATVDSWEKRLLQ